MNFSVRKNERIEAFSTMFSSKSEAESVAKAGGSVSFVSEAYAKALGFPCGGWAVLNPWGKPQELFTEAV